MATKLKSNKYSPWVKALCLFLSVAMIFLSGVFIVRVVTIGSFFGVDAFKDSTKNSKKPEFVQTEAVTTWVRNNVSEIMSLTGVSGDVISEELNKNRESCVDEALEKYLNEKALIIKNELVYVANNYKINEDAYSAYGLSNKYSYEVPDTDAADQKYPVDPYAPVVVKTVQKILNYAEGQEFLKYQNLVREDAFGESKFYFTKTYYVDDESFYLSMEDDGYYSDEQAEKKYIENRFDEFVKDMAYKTNRAQEDARVTLGKAINFKYYVKKGDKIVSNIKNPDEELAYISTHKAYYFKNAEKNITVGFDTNGIDYSGTNEFLSYCDTAAFYIADNIESGDELGSLYEIYNNTKSANILPDAIAALVCFVLSVSALVCLLNLSGHKTGEDATVLSFVDKVPGDVHTVISGGITAAIVCLLLKVFEYAFRGGRLDFMLYAKNWVFLTVGCACAAVWLVLSEWLCSFVRIKKHSDSWLKTFITFKVLFWVCKKIKKIFLWVGGIIKYKPGSFSKNKYRIFIATVILFNIVSLLFAFNFETWPLWVCCVAVMDICAVYTARIFKDLDKVILAAQKRTCAEFGGKRVPEFIRTLNDSLRVTNAEMQLAVADAVKNERTKAELITNVSHDLKTPLTSVISYVDLLKKCDIKDKDALKYIKVLDEKSQNLKSLIENLVEASKVSTGNVKLNRTILNLKELAVQAVVEYSPEFESRELDLRFNEDSETVNIFADGPHTYRILENLLSNAKKYSAPGSRVYVRVYRQEDNGVFEIKNISKAPLDISPEELTERFVRGDSSRGEEEGNGLGLSIAKELCSLQGGRLVLSIDGDLFKATVILPAK